MENYSKRLSDLPRIPSIPFPPSRGKGTPPPLRFGPQFRSSPHVLRPVCCRPSSSETSVLTNSKLSERIGRLEAEEPPSRAVPGCRGGRAPDAAFGLGSFVVRH